MRHEKDTMVSDYITNTQILLSIIKRKPMYKKTSQIRQLLKKPMIQQTLLQSYAYIRKDRVHWANRFLTVNGAKDTDISKQIIYNSQFKDKHGCPVDRS